MKGPFGAEHPSILQTLHVAWIHSSRPQGDVELLAGSACDPGSADQCALKQRASAPHALRTQTLKPEPTWTPKVCKIVAFMAVIMGSGLLFYILLGFRYTLNPACEARNPAFRPDLPSSHSGSSTRLCLVTVWGLGFGAFLQRTHSARIIGIR